MKATVTLVVLLALGLTSCSSGTDNGATPPSPASSPSPSATPGDAELTRSVCLFVNDAASTQLLDETLAVGGGAKGPAVRTGVATSYDGFARRLAQLALQSPEKLRSALADWTGASTEVAKYVTATEPSPGVAVDYGPAQPKWNAARKTTEQLCGHKLPDTGSH
ncbi:hypothetical protein [Amycolatopsis jejuensis]|uniref:hypothetical protein n=1 Tax=Amycolatopsis jejuensis TaxID=330084 RepID=UPI000527ECC9|nr:hypothetical protein [Amycolatopsis jejuensis]